MSNVISTKYATLVGTFWHCFWHLGKWYKIFEKTFFVKHNFNTNISFLEKKNGSMNGLKSTLGNIY